MSALFIFKDHPSETHVFLYIVEMVAKFFLVIRLLFYLCLCTNMLPSVHGVSNTFYTTISRVNYGSNLRRITTVKLVSENFLQSFMIKLPPTDMSTGRVFPPLFCPDNTTDVRRLPIHCTTHSPFTEFVRNMHSENVKKLRDNIEEMYAIFVITPTCLVG